MNKEKFPYACCNCKQNFNIVRNHPPAFTPRNPLLIKCGHAVCELCVKNSLKANGKVMCNLCATVTATGVPFSNEVLRKEFPFFKYLYGTWTLRNFYDDTNVSFNLSNLSNQKKGALKQEPKFDPCFDCPLPAFFTCDQCEVNYCKNCFEKLHVTQPQYVTHTKSKAKPKSQQSKKVSFSKQPQSMCKEHGNVKEFYCYDHDLAICAHCAIFKHSGHRVEPIGDRNEKAIPQLQESMKRAIDVVGRISYIQKSVSAESAVKKFQSQSIKNLQAIEKEATLRFAKLNGLLQVKENDIFNKIREERANLLGAYVQLEEELANSKSNIQSLLDEAKEAVENKGKNVNVLDLQKMLDEISLTVPSDMCIENESSDESAYKLVEMSDAVLSAAFKEYIDTCFKLDCPTVPKIKLVSAKDISGEARAEEMKDTESISSMTKFYGVNETVKEAVKEDDTSLPETSRSTSQASLTSEPEKSDKAESLGRSSPLILSRQLSALKEGAAELVSVAHINSPSEFYVHRKGVPPLLDENLIKYKRYITSTNPEMPSSVEKGGIYLVPFGGDNKWYRAKVLKSNIEDFPTKAQVQYIDYGNVELVEKSKFKILPARSIQEPAYAIRCSLFDCHPRTESWNDEALKKMVELTTGVEVMMHVMNVTEMGLEVDVVQLNDVNNISVRDALIFLELAAFLPSSATKPMPQKAESQKTQLCPKKNFAKGAILECQLSHAVSPDEFYCVELDDHYRLLLELMTEMTELYSNVVERPNVVMNPVVGMPVAARFSEDDKWYRAVITGLPGKRLVDVFYVDFGNSERVSFKDVRDLLAKFHRMSTQAIHCSLCDILPVKKSKKWPESASRILDELVYQPARMVIQEVKMVDNQPHVSVVLFAIMETADICINAHLVEEKAAVSTGINSTTVIFKRVGNLQKLTKLRDFIKPRDEAESVVLAAETVSKQAQKAAKKKTKAKQVEVKVQERKDSEVTLNPDETDVSCSVSVASDTTQTKSVDSVEAHRIEVRVLSAPSPGQFFVRLLNQEVENYISVLNASLDEFYTGSVPCAIAVWKKNDICVAFNPDDGHWYRSIIQEVVQGFEDEAYKVTMKDIGVEKVVEKKHLRPIQEKFVKEFMDGSIRCHLAGVLAAGGGDKWASYSCERFSEELNKYASVFITKKGQINEETKSLPVDLWVKHVTYGGALEPDVEEWRSMNVFVVAQGLAIPDRTYQQYIAPAEDLLNELKQMQQASSSNISSDSYVVSWLRSTEDASQVSDSASEEAVQKIEVKTIQVKKSKKRAANLQESITDWKPAIPLDVLDLEIVPTNVNNDNMIYFHEVSREDTLKQIEQALQQSFKDTKPQPQDMFWSAGQPCIAQYHSNGMWYRGKIMKVNDDNSYSVQFVDYGNIEECRAHELRKRVALADLPLYCHSLYLADLKPISADGKWPTDVLDFVHSNVVEKTCKVKLEESPLHGGAYIARSFAPPGGIELSDILVGMHYAVRVSSAGEDSSSTLSDSSEDVVVVSSSEPTDTQNIAVVIAQKWTDENTHSPPDQTIDSIVASIMKPLDPVDLISMSLSSKSSKSSVLEEPTFKSGRSSVHEEPTFKSGKSSVIEEPTFKTGKSSNFEEPTFKTGKSSDFEELTFKSGKSSVIEEPTFKTGKSSDFEEPTFKTGKVSNFEEPTFNLSRLSRSSSSKSSVVEEKINIVPVAESSQLSGSSASLVNSAEVSALSIESLVHQTGGQLKEILSQKAENLFQEDDEDSDSDEDESEAFPKKPETVSDEMAKERINEFGDFLEFPMPLSEEKFGAEVTAVQSLTSYYVQITQTSDETLQSIQNEYKEMFKEMQEEAPSGRPLLEPLRLGQECCALYDEDDNWYRAVIVEKFPAKDDSVMVRFADFGNKQVTPIKNLRPLKRKWMDIPRQCLCVKLHEVEKPESVDSDIAFSLLVSIIFTPVTVVVKDYSRMAVQLFKIGTDELVYQPLLDLGMLKVV